MSSPAMIVVVVDPAALTAAANGRRPVAARRLGTDRGAAAGMARAALVAGRVRAVVMDRWIEHADRRRGELLSWRRQSRLLS